MTGCLSLTQEEGLKLKKLLDRLNPAFLYDHESSLSFQVACKLLNEFTDPLSISKTKELIQKLLFFRENHPIDLIKREQIASLLKELYKLCEPKELNFSGTENPLTSREEVMGHD